MNLECRPDSARKRALISRPLDAAVPNATRVPTSVLSDKAAAKKARKLERRRLRTDVGMQSLQQLQLKISEEERAERKAAKRARQALARAEASVALRSSQFHLSSAVFQSHITPAVASSHPFAVTDERDHAETPFEA